MLLVAKGERIFQEEKKRGGKYSGEIKMLLLLSRHYSGHSDGIYEGVCQGRCHDLYSWGGGVPSVMHGGRGVIRKSRTRSTWAEVQRSPR